MALTSADRLRRIVLILGFLVAVVFLGPYFGIYIFFDPPQLNSPGLAPTSLNSPGKSISDTTNSQSGETRRPLAELRQSLNNSNRPSEQPNPAPTKKSLTEIEELLKEE